MRIKLWMAEGSGCGVLIKWLASVWATWQHCAPKQIMGLHNFTRSLMNSSQNRSAHFPLHAQSSSNLYVFLSFLVIDVESRDSLVCASRPNPLLMDATTLLRPCSSSLLGIYNVSNMSMGQLAGLSRTLDNIDVDICCLQETRIQGSSGRITADQQGRYFLLALFWGQWSWSFCSEEGGHEVVLNAKAEASTLEWIPVGGALFYPSEARVTQKGHELTNDTCLWFPPVPHIQTAVWIWESTVRQRLYGLLRAARKVDIVVLARLVSTAPSKHHLWGNFVLNAANQTMVMCLYIQALIINCFYPMLSAFSSLEAFFDN